MRVVTGWLRKLAADTRGGAEMLVLGYAIIAVLVMGGLTTLALTSGMTAANQRAHQTAESGVRTTIGQILSELNAGGANTDAILAALPGRSFSPDVNNPVRSTVTVEGVRFDGATVYVDVEVDMVGRMDWTRVGTASITLAHATSLADVVDGKAVWDFAAPSELTDYDENVVALWTVGDMVVYDPAAVSALLKAPTPPTVTVTMTSGTATLRAVSAGGCPAGTTVKLEARVKQDRSAWTAWSTDAAATTVTRTVPEGSQVTMEGRTSCIRGADQSPFAVSSDSIRRSLTALAAPGLTLEVDRNGDATATATASPAPSGYERLLQVRVRVSGSAWSDWSQGVTVTVPMTNGQKLEAQSRLRLIGPTDDSGWVESNIRNARYVL